ncbi:dopamine N-acetyltransferase-like [Hyposmocoma kahamanoa]|uniref:dopamine N-acetyltransferase-like n=1 Tax=Hyposmocoma kahamanoa TaxID=1477025 RepID=UPI000E6D91F3|nr:dopamine N-acetyltransferase-like [Hyposmocoma kahamanoa]
MQPNYTLRAVTLEEKEIQAVLQFATRIFEEDEPLNTVSQSLVDASDIGEHLIAILRQSLSVLALDDGGEIIGVSLNGLIKREEAETNNFEFDPKTCEDGILQLLLHVRREDKMWDKLPKTCNTVLELHMCAVRSDWRGKGVMTALTKKTERMARTTCAAAVRIEATSAFSAKVAEKLGYKEIYRLPYKDQIYTPSPAPPHLDMRVYIKEL